MSGPHILVVDDELAIRRTLHANAAAVYAPVVIGHVV